MAERQWFDEHENTAFQEPPAAVKVLDDLLDGHHLKVLASNKDRRISLKRLSKAVLAYYGQ
jgi:hypothetical protein